MTKISDIVSINSQAVLSNAIQLSWYNDPLRKEENDRLASGYVFGNSLNPRVGGQSESSSLPVFEKIRDAYGNPQASNIFTVIANYGHGKSHFALVLANYFGLSPESPVIAETIRHIEACSNAVTADQFRQFKKSTSKPHLVIALSGTDFQDLRQGFLQALRKALDAHETTRELPIRSLSTNAANWLKSLDAAKVAQADKYLGDNHETDVDSLISSLENFESGKEIIVKDLSQELLGIQANFGADANLKEVVKDAVNTLCSGKDAPFHKLLILFDELGVYAEKWCHKPVASGGLAPQEIFEACSDLRGKLCFVGFVQRELSEFVKGYPPEVQTEFQRWAGRMLPDAVYLLVSNLEEVISKLLLKEPQWKQVISENAPTLVEESEIARESIQWYNDNWTTNNFYNTVTRDCFPLHPLTTGLLCRFEFTSGARTIIGVVDSMLEGASDRRVSENGRPNWIRAIELVKEFKTAFGQKDSRDFAAYEHVITNALTTDADSILLDVLKALFLFKEVKMTKQNKYTHAEVLAPLAGYSLSETEKALLRLQNDYDAVGFSKQKQEYEFTGIGSSRVVVLDMARQAIVGKTVDSFTKALEKLNAFDTLPRLESLAREFKSDFGIVGDEWCLASCYINARKLSADEVKRLCKQKSDEGNGRGVVINLISGSTAELDEARQYAEVVISELKEEDFKYPFLIGVPANAATQLEKHILVKDYISFGMSGPQKTQFADSHRAAQEFIDNELSEELIEHLRSVEYVLPNELTLKFGNRRRTLDEIADALFTEAYKFRAPSNSDSMKPSATTGNSATAEIAKQLIVNELHFEGLNTQKQNIVTQVLVEGSKKWGIVDSRSYKVRSPQDPRVAQAWSFLGNKISKDDWTSFDALIRTLLQPPYGYDEYTVTLLISAWIGKHKHELGFKDSRKTPTHIVNRQTGMLANIALSDLQNNLNRSKEFVKFLRSYVSVQHSGVAVQSGAKSFLNSIQNVNSFDEGASLLAKGDSILRTLAPGDELIEQIQHALQELTDWLKETKGVESKLDEYRSIIEQAADIGHLLRIQNSLTVFGTKHAMQSNMTFVETLRLVDNKIEHVSRSLSNLVLTRIESFDSLKDKLESARKDSNLRDRPDLAQLFVSALEKLEADYNRLQAEANEQPLINELNVIKVVGMPLKYFSESLEQIKAIRGNAPPSNVEKLAVMRQQLVEAQIDKLRKFAENAPLRLSNVNNLSDAEALQSDILRNEFLFNDSPEAVIISEVLRDLSRKIDEFKNSQKLQLEEANRRRKLEIETITAKNISKEFVKIRGVEQRFTCLKEMLDPKNDLGFSDEQKQILKSLLD